MYISNKWKMNSLQDMHDFIFENGFATLISEALEASHLPLILNQDEGEFGALYGHFARANSHWQKIDGSRILVIFSGPHAYISPSWYELKPAVPTWNYSAVHVLGTASLTDEDLTLEFLDKTVKRYDPELVIPEQYRLNLSRGIVGFKINIESIQGQEKLGQHRSNEDQLGVKNALSSHKELEERLLYQYMIKRDIGVGS